MKYTLITVLASFALLTACSNDSDSTDSSSKAVKGHFFDQAYECSHDREVTSKRTGKTRTVKYTSFYSPQKAWRIDLTDVGADKSALGGRGIANMYTPGVRYDGVYRESDGAVSRIKFGTAWPRKDVNPDRALSNLSKKKKKNCKILADASVFDIDYLDTLEIMDQ